MNNHSKKIGRWQGAGLMATTLLGTGVFILPQMTLKIAGQGAIIAWFLLTLAIIPVTLIFAKLAAKFPHAAGPAYFVEQAFGPIAGRTIGLIFLFVVPLGAPAAILMTFQFVDSLIQLTGATLLLTELSVLLLLFTLNYRGIKISAKLQFLLTLAIVAVVVLLFGIGNLQSHSEVTTRFPNMDVNLIMAAAGLAFWSFLGVEAMTHLASDFKNPKKDLIPAMMIGTILVGLIYLACTQILLFIPTNTELAMVGVFNQLLGEHLGLSGAKIIGILGIAGGLATVNVYTASVARLVWSFSNDGVLPSYFSTVNQYNVPVRALMAILSIMAFVLIVTFLTGQNIEDLIAWCNGVFVVIYFASMLAAFRLLSTKNRPLILLSCVFCLMLIWGLGWQMMYAVLLIFITAPLLFWQHSHQTNKQLTA
ncbi:L-methionine/branched-chain amino acid transporter [Pseudoalteromonas denitrificans]|uniref:Amino acid exporter, AAE family n=1 Tax=Pseudoalteromonas denitrificans DSM 6059 TaxID=1123010 RepID=A0A1I1NJF2_9GAMM|nr:L-methionine/branched-chain amino acid transporter [Pseudoalteromonas denitrificans]SFC97791.1 amino acid exporter, AAE family [Pseudoalteromonas denitrificans DSM 6059]